MVVNGKRKTKSTKLGNQVTTMTLKKSVPAPVKLSAGLAALDEYPVFFFCKFAESYFGILEDLDSARIRHEPPETIAYLEYFAEMWHIMSVAQAQKYFQNIVNNQQGRQVLEQLNLLPAATQDIPATAEERTEV